MATEGRGIGGKGTYDGNVIKSVAMMVAQLC